jgi:hypothetical protein
MVVSVIKLDKYPSFQTWDDDTNQLVTKPMYNVISCDGCDKQMYDLMETIYQITFSKIVIFVCSKCKRKLEM